MAHLDVDPATWGLLNRLLDEALALPSQDRAGWVDALPGEYEPLKPRLRSLISGPGQRLERLPSLDDDPGEEASRERLPPGSCLGPYTVVAHLDSGGMGDVYRARDTRLDREVAVKVMGGAALDDRARARFQREARAIAALSHPNVLAIHDVGEAEGVPFLVTELLDGKSLRAFLQRGPPTFEQAVEIAAQIASGLAAAHERGIVHRDLKPENVFLLADGRVKILDFGLARPVAAPAEGPGGGLTGPGLVVGTASYVAPEVARGRAATTAADLFALGAILFELLTGRRAFDGDSTLDVLRAVVEHDPPPASSLRPSVPRWIDRIVARCLAKDAGERFRSASDLAFVLGAPADPAPSREERRGRHWMPLAAAAAAVLAAALLAVIVLDGEPRRDPPRSIPLTHSGRDAAPTVSHDGRFLAVASDRDGRRRIWLQQLDAHREIALTEGPDEAPRFSPDGSQILFTRAGRDGSALLRVGLLGGEPHKIADDASEGDWSPDGREVVFVRWKQEGAQARPTLVVAAADGSSERELARLDNRVQVRPRWSPDGRTIAVTGLVQQPGAPQTVLLVALDGAPHTVLPTPGRIGLVSAVAWDGPGALLYSQATSVTGNMSGSPGRIVRQTLGDGVATTLLWTQQSSLVLDRWTERGVVYDARSSRQILREVGVSGGAQRFVSRGTATDRQPIFSPDGERIVFSSNRGTNLDLWTIDRASGETRRLTDHPADDWDPSITADGRTLLWSSNRTGSFEVWTSAADGSRPRQVTHDGDAENPTATPDGAWIVYSSGVRGRAGIWKIRPDGAEATLLVRDVLLPEVSPDGAHVLFQTNRSPRLAVVGVASLSDGRVLPFEIRIAVHKPSPAILGRARWMPDGKAIAFVGQDEEGANGVFVQPFVPGEDTDSRRAPLAGFDPERITESFGVAPRGDRLVLAEWEQRSAVMATTGLAW
jgi:serine/threonine protein kinase/Tol biopolymer transport system component